MMFALREGSCFPRVLVGVYVCLAIVDALIALLAFSQLARIHSRTSQLGWTRQKVFHSIIGSSNMGYFVYVVLSLLASCNGWPCWSGSCGFVLMAFPKILFLAVFLLLLSFWVDLCHQPDDGEDEEEENSSQEALLGKTLNKESTDSHWRCFFLRLGHVGSRQRFVTLVIVLLFILTLAFAAIIWIGMGKNSIDSLVVARVYVDCVAVVILLLGGALACYGLILCLKMRKVRSERASSEISKVAGLAVVSVVCFTSSAFVAIFTDIPVLYQWHQQHHLNGLYTSLLLILYYLIGSSVPSAFVLWIMRELPQSLAANQQEESSTITFISDSSVVVHCPRNWTSTTSTQNQITRASPI